MVDWFIGFWKNNFRESVSQKAQNQHKCLVLLDGDEVREHYGNDLMHTLDDRLVNSMRLK